MGRWKHFVLCILILGLYTDLGCQESLEPYIVEVDQNQPEQAPVKIGQMLAGKRFIKAKLKGAVYHATMLAGADFREADLEGADLTHAMLLGANFSRANLANANFEDSMLLGVHLENAQIDGANFKNTSWLTQDQIDDACGTPKGLPEGLKASKNMSCERPTIKSE